MDDPHLSPSFLLLPLPLCASRSHTPYAAQDTSTSPLPEPTHRLRGVATAHPAVVPKHSFRLFEVDSGGRPAAVTLPCPRPYPVLVCPALPLPAR